MARKIYSGTSQYIASGATAVLHTGPGKIIGVLVHTNSATATALNLYDNTSAASPNILAVTVTAASPAVIFFPQNICPIFVTGLTGVTSANTWAFVITEAEA